MDIQAVNWLLIELASRGWIETLYGTDAIRQSK